MTNLLKFPGRPRPLPPTDELLALELELVRARLAQVRSEIRLTNTIWFWLCFRKAVFWAAVLWLLAAFAGAAQAQTRTYYDGQGRFAGTSTTRGDSRSFYGSNGQFAGSAVRYGNQSSFYDSQGRFVGSSTSTGPRR